MQTVALAFSGGLDTSYCVPRLAQPGRGSIPSTSIPAGPPPRNAPPSGARPRRSAPSSIMRSTPGQQVYQRFVRYLMQGNVLRGEVYPLSVAAERTQQAMSVIEVARSIGATAVAHGSTGAGNDQVRFDIAFRVLAPDLEILTPIRDEGLSRDAAIAYPAAARTAGASQGRCLLHQSRAVGHHLGRRLDSRHLGRSAG